MCTIEYMDRNIEKEPTDKVGSFVLKGFTVPSGYTLHYTTKTGTKRVSREGEFVDTSYKFQDIKSGKVNDWYLQKLNTGFFFDDEEYTPWGEQTSIFGVPVIPDYIQDYYRLFLKDKDSMYYLNKVRDFLVDTYGVPSTVDDIVSMYDIINRNINLLLSMKDVEELHKIYYIDSPPDVTDPNLEDSLILANSTKTDLSNFSAGLIEDLCNFYDIGIDELLESTNIPPEKKYTEYLSTNSVKIGDIFYSKSEAQDYISESLESVPEEVRPIVSSYLNTSDILNNDINQMIDNLDKSGYSFQEEISLEELNDLIKLDKITPYDLRRVKVEGYNLIQGRFEILKRILTFESLSDLLKDTENTSEQSTQDIVTEIIENYIEFLGGNIYVYRVIVKEWLKGNYENSYVKALFKWADGIMDLNVFDILPTIEAIVSAHSEIYESLDINLYKPLNFDKNNVSFEASSSLVSFTLKIDEESMFIFSKPAKNKIVLIPCLYMPKSYWKFMNGVHMYIKRDSVDYDIDMEVVTKPEFILIKSFKDNSAEVIL